MKVTKLDAPEDKPTTLMTVTDAQLALIKRTIAHGATTEELQLFLYDCQRKGVHPLDRMIHFTKRGGKYTPITSIDFMRSQAAETGEMAGSDDAVFDVKRPARPAVATVTVYRLTQGGRYAYTASAGWDEYYPGEGQPGFMWRRLPRTMLAKCAEALALRKAFPKQLHGLYAAEEMQQAGPLEGPALAAGDTTEKEYGEEDREFLTKAIERKTVDHKIDTKEALALGLQFTGGKPLGKATLEQLTQLYRFMMDPAAVADWRQEQDPEQDPNTGTLL